MFVVLPEAQVTAKQAPAFKFAQLEQMAVVKRKSSPPN
jgi:hypothetical protein